MTSHMRHFILTFIITCLFKACAPANDCPNGTYGVDCSLPCSCVSVPVDTVCNSEDGMCTCSPAFAGETCDKRDVSAYISTTSPDDAIYEGDTMTLICKTNLPLQDVENNRVHFTLSNTFIVVGSWYAVESAADVGEYRYTLPGTVTVAEHSGTYRCTVSTFIPGEGILTNTSETVIDILAPETPIIVGHVEAGSSSTLVIDWEITSNSGDPGDTTCTVQYSLSSNRIWIDVSDDILQDATRYLLTGLPTYTKYDVRISCDNQYGTSNRLELTTWTGVSYPGSPFRVTIDSIGQTTATISWYEPFVRNGPISSYRVQLFTNGAGMVIRDSDGNQPFLEIEGLMEETTYSVEIRAINRDNTGVFNGPKADEEVLFTTLPFPPSPPYFVSAIDGEDFCTVEWRPPLTPNGIVTHYTVYYTISSLCEYDAGSMPGVDETGSTDTDELEYRFQKDTMKACSRYDFTITAISSDGESDQCECTDIFCTTDTGAPDETISTPILAGAYNLNTVVVALTPVSGRSGPIACYELVVIPLEDYSDLVGLTPDDDYQPHNITDYASSLAFPGHPYVAMTFSSDFISNGSVIIIGDETSSECNDLETITTDVADTRRRRRYTADATRQETARRRSALNGPLEDGVLYSAFLRAYVVVESDKVEYASSSFMDPVRTRKKEDGPILKATVITVSAMILLLGVIGVFIVMCLLTGNKFKDVDNTSDPVKNPIPGSPEPVKEIIPVPDQQAPVRSSQEAEYVDTKDSRPKAVPASPLAESLVQEHIDGTYLEPSPDVPAFRVEPDEMSLNIPPEPQTESLFVSDVSQVVTRENCNDDNTDNYAQEMMKSVDNDIEGQYE